MTWKETKDGDIPAYEAMRTKKHPMTATKGKINVQITTKTRDREDVIKRLLDENAELKAELSQQAIKGRKITRLSGCPF